jgi:diacylglycerol kinase (ATP)
MKSKATGLHRLWKAAGYSWNGLRAAWASEAAIRQEVLALLVLVPCVFFFDVSRVEKVLLLFSAVMVLVVELLNSAIESVVDRIGPEFHELSGKAKDVGSAAVLVCFLLALATWFIILLA